MQALTTTQTLAVAAVSLATGFYLGQCFAKQSKDLATTEKASVDSEEEEEEEDLDELDALPEGSINVKQYSNFKLNLIVRTDLGMTKGKIAAQCGHATLACYKAAKLVNPEILKAWERSGQAKIALKCDSEDKLLELQAIALSLGLPAQTIQDAGRTQIAAGSRTVLGVGPGPAELIDKVTSHLKLL